MDQSRAIECIITNLRINKIYSGLLDTYIYDCHLMEQFAIPSSHALCSIYTIRFNCIQSMMLFEF